MNPKEILNAVLRTDFFSFLERVFREVEPGAEFSPAWHLETMCHVLEEIAGGRRRRQIIEVPPRSLKSICASVALPAWLLGHDPTMRILCVSYALEVALPFSAMTRQVMKSDWYREAFPRTVISSQKDTEKLFRTTAGGYRDTTSVGGAITGKGGGLIIIDDPCKPDDMESETQRTNVADWYDRTLSSRLNNKRKDAILLVMQRLHPDDLAGHVKARGGWDTLTIPAIAMKDERIPLGRDRWHVRSEGDVLDPSREPKEVLDELKYQMGSRAFEAQYQQNPLPADGGVIEWHWFRSFVKPPEPEKPQIVQSWDTASKNTEFSDYSVCTTWLVDGSNYYLLDLFRRKLTFPELYPAAVELAERWRPTTVLIEDSSAGTPLIQALKFDRPIRMPSPLPIRPEKDKRTRVHEVSPAVEQGRVFLPLGAPWLEDLRVELIQFPSGKHDDQIDSLTQFLAYAERRRMRGHTAVRLPMFDTPVKRQR